MLTNLINEFNDVFEGEPWYGASVLDSLQAMPVELLNDKPYAAGHSVAVLLKHMLAWRIFVLEKLKQNKDYKIALNSPADWDHDFIISDSREWQQLIETYKQAQQELIVLLKEREEEWLLEQVPGNDYSYRHMLNGILYHDIYHLGQIRLSWKMAEQERSRS